MTEQNQQDSLCPFSISCQKELSDDIISTLTPNTLKHTKKSTVLQDSHAVPQAHFQAVSESIFTAQMRQEKFVI